MPTYTDINRFGLIAILLFGASIANAQMMAIAPRAAPSVYTYSTAAYASETGSSGQIAQTSTSASIVAGDAVFVFCRANGSPATLSVVSSLGDTFLSTPINNTNGNTQLFYNLSMSTTGSASFTCNYSLSQNYVSIVATVYHHKGAAGALMSGSVTNSTPAGSGTTYTSPSFSTVGAGLAIVCGSVGNNGRTFTGRIGTVNSPQLTTASTSASTASDAVCISTGLPSAQTAITASITWSGSYSFYGFSGAVFQ